MLCSVVGNNPLLRDNHIRGCLRVCYSSNLAQLNLLFTCSRFRYCCVVVRLYRTEFQHTATTKLKEKIEFLFDFGFFFELGFDTINVFPMVKG